jgi:hypothetical protein
MFDSSKRTRPAVIKFPGELKSPIGPIGFPDWPDFLPPELFLEPPLFVPPASAFSPFDFELFFLVDWDGLRELFG